MILFINYRQSEKLLRVVPLHLSNLSRLQYKSLVFINKSRLIYYEKNLLISKVCKNSGCQDFFNYNFRPDLFKYLALEPCQNIFSVIQPAPPAYPISLLLDYLPYQDIELKEFYRPCILELFEQLVPENVLRLV